MDGLKQQWTNCVSKTLQEKSDTAPLYGESGGTEKSDQETTKGGTEGSTLCVSGATKQSEDASFTIFIIKALLTPCINNKLTCYDKQNGGD